MYLLIHVKVFSDEHAFLVTLVFLFKFCVWQFCQFWLQNLYGKILWQKSAFTLLVLDKTCTSEFFKENQRKLKNSVEVRLKNSQMLVLSKFHEKPSDNSYYILTHKNVRDNCSSNLRFIANCPLTNFPALLYHSTE